MKTDNLCVCDSTQILICVLFAFMVQLIQLEYVSVFTVPECILPVFFLKDTTFRDFMLFLTIHLLQCLRLDLFDYLEVL